MVTRSFEYAYAIGEYRVPFAECGLVRRINNGGLNIQSAVLHPRTTLFDNSACVPCSVNWTSANGINDDLYDKVVQLTTGSR